MKSREGQFKRKSILNSKEGSKATTPAKASKIAETSFIKPQVVKRKNLGCEQKSFIYS
jgi:hypothetical protein